MHEAGMSMPYSFPLVFIISLDESLISTSYICHLMCVSVHWSWFHWVRGRSEILEKQQFLISSTLPVNDGSWIIMGKSYIGS